MRKRQKMPNIAADVEQPECSCTACGSVNWYNSKKLAVSTKAEHRDIL